MIAAGFVTNNTDPADPFYRKNMGYAFCSACQSASECKKSDRMPMMSALSRYAIRWYHELKASPCGYPIPGSWEQQPNWFMELISMASIIFGKVEKEKAEREARAKKK